MTVKRTMNYEAFKPTSEIPTSDDRQTVVNTLTSLSAMRAENFIRGMDLVPSCLPCNLCGHYSQDELARFVQKVTHGIFPDVTFEVTDQAYSYESNRTSFVVGINMPLHALEDLGTIFNSQG